VLPASRCAYRKCWKFTSALTRKASAVPGEGLAADQTRCPRNSSARLIDALESKYDHQFKVVLDAIRELMVPPTPGRKRGVFERVTRAWW